MEIKTLLEKHGTSTIISSKPLIFLGVGLKDVYNVSAPFSYKGAMYILGRVEDREGTHSQIMFFKKSVCEHLWVLETSFPVYDLEDPFITKVGEEYVLGGVEVIKSKEHTTWRTVFYRGTFIESMKLFFKGPKGMKDIRLIELPDKCIGVFTRPQGVIGGRGKIGFTIFRSLSDFSIEDMNSAPLLDGLFVDLEWGGANEVHILKNGCLGVLAHIAKFSSDGLTRHYYPMVFSFDYKKHTVSSLHILFTREQLGFGPAKRADLLDVIFSGGLVRYGNGTCTVYVGAGDCEAYMVTIKDPFLEFDL